MRSHHIPSHLLLPPGQSLWFDFELYCLILLAEGQHIEHQSVMPRETLTFLADLFAAYPTPLERTCEQRLLGTCNDHLKMLYLTIERVSPGSYRLATRPPTQEHPVQREASPHPLVSVRRDWRRGMYTIPPFLL